MPRSSALGALTASLVLALGSAACAQTGSPTGPTAAAPPRIGAVKVIPSSGPIGTVFTLSVQGQKEGEAVAFEISFPGEGKAYPGSALTVPSDGMATTTYRVTTANKPGDYIVRLTGPPGSLAEGRFTVNDGPPLTSTVPDTASSTSTSNSRTGTTKHSVRTSTTLGSGSSTSTKASSTTATTRRTGTSSTASTVR